MCLWCGVVVLEAHVPCPDSSPTGTPPQDSERRGEQGYIALPWPICPLLPVLTQQQWTAAAAAVEK